MCGLFGIVSTQAQSFNSSLIQLQTEKLLKLSASRGKEATGLAWWQQSDTKTEELEILRKPLAPHQFIRDRTYHDFWSKRKHTSSEESKTWFIIGHSRLVTNGSQQNERNNQPLERQGDVLLHNGIVVNDDDLWKAHPKLKRLAEVDSEVLLAMLVDGVSGDFTVSDSCKNLYRQIKGTASLVWWNHNQKTMTLSTNCGSLYYCISNGMLYFASEKSFLENFCATFKIHSSEIIHLSPLTAIHINTFKNKPSINPIQKSELPESSIPTRMKIIEKIVNQNQAVVLNPEQRGILRCRNCILPATMPFIEFDSTGLCNYCQNYKPLIYGGKDDLQQFINRSRKNGNTNCADCIVAFSGGRDSSYGLHLLKKEFNLRPLAFTYDWGLVTDLGRRNQARMCGKLGIEQILVSANLAAKREYVRLNIEAWLKKPHLGMIPLFMAGDKQFFYYANRIQKQTKIPMVIFCENRLEQTRFKSGFMGVEEPGNRVYNLSMTGKLQLAGAYLKAFGSNIGYWNRSLGDTMLSYLSAYFQQNKYLFLYDYIPWNESEIDICLEKEYEWEKAEDSPSTWRIGDGSAAFYNYIYYQVAGFTEFDTFHSMQIREGHITRDEALRKVAQENQPRWKTLHEYAEVIGFNLERALKIIDAIKPLGNLKSLEPLKP